MVTRYPDTLLVDSLTESTRDSDGNWVVAVAEETEPLPCRFEPNNKGALIKAADGSDLLYAGTIWLKDRSVSVPIGSKVKVYRGETMIAKGDVKQADAAQQTTRLWL